jgi:hypothetical protein
VERSAVPFLIPRGNTCEVEPWRSPVPFTTGLLDMTV